MSTVLKKDATEIKMGTRIMFQNNDTETVGSVNGPPVLYMDFTDEPTVKGYVPVYVSATDDIIYVHLSNITDVMT